MSPRYVFTTVKMVSGVIGGDFARNSFGWRRVRQGSGTG